MIGSDEPGATPALRDRLAGRRLVDKMGKMWDNIGVSQQGLQKMKENEVWRK